MLNFPLVAGGFGAWSPWYECSVSCGGGVKNRIRHCNRPVPSNGGADCAGEKNQTVPCNGMACPGLNCFK